MNKDKKVKFEARVLPKDKKLFYSIIDRHYPHDTVGVAWGKIVRKFENKK